MSEEKIVTEMDSDKPGNIMTRVVRIDVIRDTLFIWPSPLTFSGIFK